MMRVRVELHGLFTVGGAGVSLDRTLKDGEEVCLYPVFSGG
jgi:molybdopterin converting factor small subunit